jgi:hypothetical protein
MYAANSFKILILGFSFEFLPDQSDDSLNHKTWRITKFYFEETMKLRVS